LRNLVKGGQKRKLTPLYDDDIDSDADDDDDSNSDKDEDDRYDMAYYQMKISTNIVVQRP